MVKASKPTSAPPHIFLRRLQRISKHGFRYGGMPQASLAAAETSEKPLTCVSDAALLAEFGGDGLDWAHEGIRDNPFHGVAVELNDGLDDALDHPPNRAKLNRFRGAALFPLALAMYRAREVDITWGSASPFRKYRSTMREILAPHLTTEQQAMLWRSASDSFSVATAWAVEFIGKRFRSNDERNALVKAEFSALCEQITQAVLIANPNGIHILDANDPRIKKP